jgi:hypothetical protein
VNQLIDTLAAKYPSLTLVTRGVDKGVGKLVQNRCRPKIRGGKVGEFPYIEEQVKVWAEHLTQAEMAAVWEASNAFLVSIGEEFHLFCDKALTGVMHGLFIRVKNAGIPYSLYYPGVDLKPKMVNL